MSVKFPLLTGLIPIYFTCLVRCGTLGFIFPAEDTSSNATVSDIEVRFNDSMVVEYTFGAAEIVLLGQSCYNYSASPPGEYSENPQTFYLSSSFNNTGTLLWNVGNGNNGNYAGINFCRLTLQDFTIRECAWGPFGLISFTQITSNDYYLTSMMFSMLQPAAQPATITNPAEKASQSSTPLTATASGKAICPPSGIPPMPIVRPVPQIDLYPPMAQGVVFPSGEPQENLFEKD